jgi:hypothetical protein
VEDTDYSLELQPIEEDDTLFKLKITYLQQEFTEQITINISNITWANPTNSLITGIFPASEISLTVTEKTSYILSFIGENTQTTISKGADFTATYGAIFATVLP